jgi:hypothetical protein
MDKLFAYPGVVLAIVITAILSWLDLWGNKSSA